jgi:hypothetical protein
VNGREIVGALSDSGDGGFDGAVPGDHDDRKIGIDLLEIRQEIEAVHAAALQPDVQDDQ